MSGRAAWRTTRLAPQELQAARRLVLDRPLDLDRSRRPRQRAIFRGIGRQLMHQQRDVLRAERAQQNRWPLHIHPFGESDHLRADHPVDRRALPIGLDQQIMRRTECRQPIDQHFARVVGGPARHHGAANDRLNYGDHIFTRCDSSPTRRLSRCSARCRSMISRCSRSLVDDRSAVRSATRCSSRVFERASPAACDRDRRTP